VSTSLPLAAAQARLGKPGRPRTRPLEPPANGDRSVTGPSRTRMKSGEDRRALATQASALLPRLLSIQAAAGYLSLSEDVVLELLEAGTFQRVIVPAPVTAKRRGGVIRKVLLDRLQLDAAVTAWTRPSGTGGGLSLSLPGGAQEPR
jgi:hypothetical protein